MSKQKPALAGKNSRDERGDPSEKALKVTIVLCLVGLIGVYLFAFAPSKKGPTAPPAPTVARSEAKAPVAQFDRQSLSTKNR